MDKSRGISIKKPLRVINDFTVGGKEAPLQNQVRDFVIKYPNCTLRDMADSKELGKLDQSGIRRAIRKMVESHKIIQRFSI